jgi:hypothetical protein
MNLSAPRDEYCERLGPGLFAEPVNALSNLAFFIAAFLLWQLLRRAYAGRSVPASLQALPVLIALIGFGSTAYHSFAVVWAEILDVLFIGIFIYFYIVCFLRYFLGLQWKFALLGLPGFWLFGAALGQIFPADAFNGSTRYFPALLGILLMGATLAIKRQPQALTFFIAAGVFLISLILRTNDQVWCSHFPLGTHWLWHCLNAVTLSLVAAAMIRAAAAKALA